MKRQTNKQTGGCCGYDTPIGRLVIEDDGEGITALHFAGRAEDQARPSALTDQAAKELAEYFAGERREFSVLLHPMGTEFQRAAWAALCAISFGETRSYAQIAQAINNPKACRAVGMANNKNPIPIFIPCHRVVGSDGSLTGYAGGLDVKRKLLEIEGCLQTSGGAPR